ncbi:MULTISPECIES: MerR family DNA-binding protein [Amycolatopsis]|uniref:MerR family DNA-binding protein n=1 Tax=Amycolatopsis TaxID=1813 RepID=UPI0033A23BDB
MLLTVGQAAKAAGLTRRAVRLYEERGLMRSAPRTAAGYRVYDQDDIDTLIFIRRARALDLPVSDIGAILDVHRRGTTPCTMVGELVDSRIAEVDRAIAELEALRATLVSTRSRIVPAGSTEQDAGVCPVIERHALVAGCTRDSAPARAELGGTLASG